MKMKFRLQRVLDLRAAEEREAQRELGTLQQAHQLILDRLDRLREAQDSLFDFLKQQKGCSIDLLRLQHGYAYSAKLEKELFAQEKRRQESSLLVEQQRERVKGCWRKRRMLEILKGKAEAKFREVVGKEEQKQLDELVLFAFAESSRERLKEVNG